MIKITAELLPYGRSENKRHLGTLLIANTGTGTKRSGNYRYMLYKAGSTVRRWKEGEISGFPRLRLLVWDLLYRILRDIFGDRNK